MKRLAVVAATSFTGAALGLFWLTSWGTSTAFLWVLAFLIAGIIAETVLAMAVQWTTRNLLIGATLLAGQAGVLFAAMLAGREFFAWSVLSRLDDYRVIAEQQLIRSRAKAGGIVIEDNPHPDFVSSRASTFPDGGEEVVFTFAHQPRWKTLIFEQKRALPQRDRDSLCLISLDANWFWYRACGWWHGSPVTESAFELAVPATGTRSKR